jgi:phosphatidyl-myo-inositol alpha-mannosyltransferase
VRVALVCPYAWDEPGGVQVHVRELGLRLAGRGHHVIVLAPSVRPPAEPWVLRVGGPIRLPYGQTRAPISPWPSTRWRVRHELTRFGPDVVHLHEPFAPSASAFALTAEAPLVATFHSGVDRSRAYDAAAPALRRAARRIGVRIAVSERAAQVAHRRLGGAYRVIPNGIAVERFLAAVPADLGPGTKVAFVGRLHRRKGFPTAVEAFGALAAGRPDLRMVVVGDGVDRAALDQLDPATRARVVHLGTRPNADLPSILAACDAFMAPNTGGESFGLVLLEAMASSVPVVASDIPGFDEIVTDGLDGLLVPPGDADALASGIARLLDDPALAARLVASGRSRAAQFDWSIVAERVEEAYRDAVAGGGPGLR